MCYNNIKDKEVIKEDKEMKQYGANKATEFSKKQIGVIFAKAKKGELKVENFVMKNFYFLADYYGYDDNGSVRDAETDVKKILEKVFDNKLEEAQILIDEYTEKHYSRLGINAQKEADRTLV